MQSSGLELIPNRLQNTPTNAQSYQASQIICGFPNPDVISLQSQNVEITGVLQANGLQIQPGSRIEGLPDPVNNSEPITLGYLQNQQQYAQSDVSVGTIQIWFSSVIPADYLLCNGQSFDQLTYPELFTILQTNILPDLRDRFIVGANSRLLKSVQEQSDPYLIPHTHQYFKPESLTLTYVQKLTQGLVDQPLTFLENVTIDQPFERTTNQVGGGTYNNYPRNIAVNFIIKAKSTRAFRNSIQNDLLATASLIATNTSLLSNVDFNMGGFKITNLSLQPPVLDSDVVTKLYVDQTLVGGALINKLQNGLQTLTLQSTELQSTVLLNMQNHKITNVADPTQIQDAVSLNYLQTNNYTKTQSDSRYQSSLTTINNLPLATNSLNLNNQKIINLQNATLPQDATTLSQNDAKYVFQSTPLQNITLATNSLNLNNQKIINVSDATLATDALNRQTADNRYYLNTTPLQNITLATGTVNLNTNKISNLVAGTLLNDAINLSQIQQWMYVRKTVQQVLVSNPDTISFQESIQTSNQTFQFIGTSSINILQSGINVEIRVQLRAIYTDRNKRIQIRLSGSVQGILEQIYGLFPSENNEQIDTSFSLVLANVQAQSLTLQIIPVDFTKVQIAVNTSMFIKRLY